jgi:23S rRNA (guanosine2251-2'-O)-methyltransferase
MSLVYGIHAIEEALRAEPCRIEKICLERGQRNPRLQVILSLAKEKHVPFAFEEKKWLDRKADGQRHQGVLGYLVEMALFGVEEIVKQAQSPGLLLILDGVEDPHNVGAILRSAEVAGADGVFLPQRHSPGLSSTVMKASSGAASHIKITRIPNTVQLIQSLKSKGYWVAGLEEESGQRIWDADFTVPTLLVMGNEGKGLHRLVKENCDFLVSIPIRGKVSSHNVSVAAGIVLYEVLRQRESRKNADMETEVRRQK